MDFGEAGNETFYYKLSFTFIACIHKKYIIKLSGRKKQ